MHLLLTKKILPWEKVCFEILAVARDWDTSSSAVNTICCSTCTLCWELPYRWYQWTLRSAFQTRFPGNRNYCNHVRWLHRCVPCFYLPNAKNLGHSKFPPEQISVHYIAHLPQTRATCIMYVFVLQLVHIRSSCEPRNCTKTPSNVHWPLGWTGTHWLSPPVCEPERSGTGV